MFTPPHDVQTVDDIRHLVSAFYNDIEADPVIGTFFVGLDWNAHLPQMVRFWSSVAFQTATYQGRPFDAHLKLDRLQARHFERWLARFHATVDAHYVGPTAERMKARASQIAVIFQVKMGLWQDAPTA